MATSLRKGNSEFKSTVNIERDGFYQVIPSQDTLLKLCPQQPN